MNAARRGATFAARRERVIAELALATVADPRAHPDDVAEARRALMPRVRPDRNTLTVEQRDQLRALLRVALGMPPKPGGEPAPAAASDAAAPPAPIELAEPIDVGAPSAPDPDELGVWPAR